jgi:Cyclic nucleotide-binding domain
VDWLVSQPRDRARTAAFGHALKLFACGTSVLGMAADDVRVDWYPAGSYIVEQGEPATELFCILSGTADVIVEGEDGSMEYRDSTGVGDFFGEIGLATGRPRNAHVIAQDAVTCLVLAPEQPSPSAGRGAGALPESAINRLAESRTSLVEDCVTVNVSVTLERKVHALAAHQSQYAFEPGLLPVSLLERLLGKERFVVVHPHD